MNPIILHILIGCLCYILLMADLAFIGLYHEIPTDDIIQRRRQTKYFFIIMWGLYTVMEIYEYWTDSFILSDLVSFISNL